MYTVPTVAIRFWLAFSPFVRCAGGAGSSGSRRITIPLPSALATTTSPSSSAGGRERVSRYDSACSAMSRFMCSRLATDWFSSSIRATVDAA